ncbi:uracil-DNA glycosylase family protein [Stappia sp. F7233]|uniref:Uracil-DNA glycosylase family protein n=1 Tax=Stappia albiluteola TaxID=2758565 RepID=A0A839AAD5_9HYPH|nr:uracil-DNA glycosylase family protein [Stappia albiluteola]MBA5775892.1 uracil-DNA glycosylase family protein [Stappia albiluteola]
MSGIEGLLRDVRACTLCAGLPLGPRPILQAAEGARILIAGQAPGRKAHERGLPFDDASGDRLRAWLGVDRDTFYDASKIAILPMGFCFPGTGKSGDLPPRPECAPQWRRTLLDALENVELTLVIGQYAQAWHLGARQSDNLTKTVQDWRSFWPQLLPLPHPSPRNLRWFKQNPFFETDILPVLQDRVKSLIG